MLTEFEVTNFRSVKHIYMKMRPITVLVGANGSGKSNLYRALKLLQEAARGRLADAIATENGIASALFSGPRGDKNNNRIKLAVTTENYRYGISFGRIPLGVRYDESFFQDDLDIKSESLELLTRQKTFKKLLTRRRSSIEAVDNNGVRTDYTTTVPTNASVLGGLGDPLRYPGLHRFKMEVLSWRFYESFRTDKGSPLRLPQPGVFSGTLDATGNNLAAAIASIVTTDDSGDFENALDEAFPGTTLKINAGRQGLKLSVNYPGMARSLEAPELSDGTLQYIALLTALHPLDPPPLLAINEPETSIHDDLMEPLAKAIVRASETSQIWVTTHSRLLSDYILEYGGYDELTLEKIDGETGVVGLGIDGRIIENDDEDEDEGEEEEDDDLNP